MAAFLVFSCLLFAQHSLQQNPFPLTWSSTTYGPDGPWHAVTVQLGSDLQLVDLYPGGNYGSTVMSSSLCTNTSFGSTCYADKAGTYTRSTSHSSINGSASFWESYLWSYPGEREVQIVLDRMTIFNKNDKQYENNITLYVIDNASMTYPGNISYQPSVGFLSLGAPSETLNYPRNSQTKGWWITSRLWEDSIIPSIGYGLHLGSAATDPPVEPSLYLGGYDTNRVLGEISTQSVYSGGGSLNGGLVIQLNDVALGVEEGDSPFSFQNKTKAGLLQTNGTSLGSSPQLSINTIQPYLYLPTATCEAITAYLPVYYNTSLGLYIWNTSDPNYEIIVKSPAYLSFNFIKDSDNNKQLEIKVPFALLNLTLEAPLVDTPTRYLPLAHHDTNLVFGRAFMQAAFIGVNWGADNSSGTWFLAQAPGPNLISTPHIESMNAGTDNITGSSSSWANTWSSYWTPVTETSSSSGQSSSTKSKIGVGVGVGVGIGGALVVLGVAAFVLRRKRAARQHAVAVQSQDMLIGSQAQHPKELGAGRENIPPVEASADTQPRQRHELA
ncbi:hypothetical protein ASPWEDRAFT_43041 [Aspergillus wentii DTO 134E9]|uniref:Peptidase A1 domain-containing protein n=1 Tax=Aspergillus wentii DTO 134E9 TaxID=1073089 RepID=A0A1L9RDH4_ASPWE|nr:uncharacterized protein ASPWEDRAFT_43041 [Aspergillus wentii DTO 134E9]KAI9933270.1 hypothetical protein MW887_007743 [Aspergillus wentii]OJJ32999.1 hypothetical protein ASPWEDRAFT_43041 [Aspergillus wentii DTO 134E9]